MDAEDKKEYRRYMLPYLILLLVLLSLFLCSGCGTGIQFTKTDMARGIRLATDYQEGDLGYQQLQMFAQSVAEKSDGVLKVQIYGKNEWSTAESFTSYLKTGELELACLPAAEASLLQPLYAIYEQPYLFSNLQTVERYVSGTVAATALQKLPQYYPGVGFVANGYSYLVQQDNVQLYSYGMVKHFAEIHALDHATVYDVRAQYQLHPLLASDVWWDTLTVQEQRWIQESFQESLESIFIHQKEIAPQRLLERGVLLQTVLPVELAGYTELWMGKREAYFLTHSDSLTVYWRPTVTVPVIGEEI